MKVESFISRLEKNKLSKRRSITSFITLKANIMTNNHNKNEKNKLVMKERAFSRSSMENTSSAIKLNI